VLIFSTKHDGTLKGILRHTTPFDEMLCNEAFREEWESICNGAGVLSGAAAAAAASAPEAFGSFRLVADCLGDNAAEVIAALSEDEQASLREYEEEARMLVSSMVKLVDGSDNKNQALLTILRESTIGKIRGGIDGYVVALYDLKASGEHSKRPSSQPPPLRREHATKMVRAFLRSRLSPSTDDIDNHKVPIHSGDMLVFLDGGRPSFHGPLQSGMKGSARTSRTLNLVYSEEALLKRRRLGSQLGKNCARGFMTLKQLEQVLLVTAEDAAKLGKRANKYFEGSTTGDVLAPIGVPDLQSPIETWRLTVGEKRHMMGDARSMGQAVTAEKTVADGSSSTALVRDDDQVEPMNFEQMLPEVYGEVLYRAGAKAVIDLTCSDGVLAAECLTLSIPYLGMCYSPQHAAALGARLSSVVFRKFVTENSGIYKSALASMLSKKIVGCRPKRNCSGHTTPGSSAKKIKRSSLSAAARLKAKVDPDEDSLEDAQATSPRP